MNPRTPGTVEDKPTGFEPGPRYPIIFTYYPPGEMSEYPPYFPLALAQARAANPHSPIILLSPWPFKFASGISSLDDGVFWIPVVRSVEKLERLRRSFVNLSNRPFRDELARIERWFLVRDFLETHAIERFAYVNQDVLLYGDFGEASAALGRPDVAHAGEGWDVSVFESPRLISEFCDLVSEAYDRSTLLWYRVLEDSGILRPRVEGEEPVPRPIGESYFISLLRERHPKLRIARLDQVTKAGRFDLDRRDGRGGLASADGAESLRWREGLPFTRELDGQGETRMLSVCFPDQASRKRMPSDFLKTWNFWSASLRSASAEVQGSEPKWLDGMEALQALQAQS